MAAAVAAVLFAAACATPPAKRARPAPPPDARRPPTEAELNSSEPGSGPTPIEPDKMGNDPFVMLDGKPFPAAHPFEAKLPKPRRILYVAGAGPARGDGSEGRPWSDLQAALETLAPGDRLVVKAGAFPGSFRIGERCREGTSQAPIQVFFEGAILQPVTEEAALTLARAHWSLDGLWVVLANSGAPAVAVAAPAHDVLINHAQIYQGTGSGVVVGAGAASVTVANAHIHNLGLLAKGRPSYGVDILAGARDVKVVASKIHHNASGSVRIGSGDGAAPDGVALLGNRIHDDRRPGILVLRGRQVRIEGNQIYNYRPVGRAWGQAVLVEDGEDVSIEGNHIAEASVGVQIGRGDPGKAPRPGPRGVTVLRNYLENRLTGDAAGVVGETGRGVRVCNNVLDHYASGILFFGVAPGGWAAANNLVLDVSDTAFLIADQRSLSVFDANGFSPRRDSVDVQVGGETLSLSDYLVRGAMPKSRVARGVVLEGRDLAKVKGLETVDQGQALEGLTFAGRAPDFGVAER